MSGTSPDSSRRNPFIRPGFIVSAALIVALIAAVIVIVFFPRNNGSGAASPPSGSASVAASPSASRATDESICGLPASEQTALGTAPASDWELVGSFAAPTSPDEHGPGVVSNGLRSCFSHDVTGALYAAANIAALATTGKEEAIYRELSVPSPAQQQALERITPTAVASDLSVQIAGFQITNYTGQSAVIRLGIRGSNAINLDYPVPLEWHNGDWKLVVPPTGDLGVREIANFTGFISWSGA